MTNDYKTKLIESLKDPSEAEAYLNASIEAYMEDGNIQALMLSFKHLIKVSSSASVSKTACDVGVSRQHLYKILDGESNTNVTTFFHLLDSLGFTVEVKKKPQLT